MKQILAFALLLTLSFQVVASEVVQVRLIGTDTANSKLILTANSGMTLYTFDVDGVNESRCFGACLATWPALVTELSELPLPFSIITRPSGEKQIALNGSPLYFFAGDTKANDVNGDGLGGVWHIIKFQ
ncbi:hypothetical protein A9Q84_16320 [Halobacteriovorax marinus]|uniref:Lipoprotein n=1 Tax=Halobacteriovorax marinus TaxID=97084 RepID=A0A1Y5F9R2_9BACT|nr:hypothetical protein A9Q84_16320 [Halobacteriovorax marinus]